MICPACDGAVPALRHVNTGSDSSKHRWEQMSCFRCGGSGVINADWFVRGQILKKARVALRLTLLEASKRIKMSPSEISSMELGKILPVAPEIYAADKVEVGEK